MKSNLKQFALLWLLFMVAVTAKATVSNGTLSWQPVTGATAYAVFKNNVFQAIVTQPSFAGADDTNTWSVRAANPMGGFGEPIKASVVNAVAEISTDRVVSTSYYSMNGTKLSRLQQGVNLRVSHLSDGTTITDKVVVK